MRPTCLVFLLIIFAQSSYQKSTPESNSYIAAVTEFSPTIPNSKAEPPNKINAARYVEFIQKAARQNADIIVFPEDGLTSLELPSRSKLDPWTTIIPAPSTNYNPCIHSTIPVSEALKTISCAARDNMIYVVVDIAEKVICTNESCPTDKRLYYNSMVAFDREGKIIARYRKVNLYTEPIFNVTAIPEIVTFETDFGVTFGTFICFDILFKKPSVYLTRMLNVTDVVFATAWFSEIPFLTALQTQYGWSYAEDVNFLVSGYDWPRNKNAGSGIYLGRQGIARAIIPTSDTNHMLVAEVPKKNIISYHRSRPRYDYNPEDVRQPIHEEEHHVHDELRRRRSVPENSLDHETPNKRTENPESISNASDVSGLSLFREDLSSYSSYRFNSSTSRKLCHEDFCCDFGVEISGEDTEGHYRMMVYNGTRTFYTPITVGLMVCAVVRCSNDSLSSCGHLEKSDVVFNALSINATFPDYEEIIVIPSSIGPDLMPLAQWGYEERYDDAKRVEILAKLNAPTGNLVTAGLYTRVFTRDVWGEETSSKSGMQWATLTALAIVSIFLLFLYRKGWRKPWQRNNQLSSDAGPYQNLQTR